MCLAPAFVLLAACTGTGIIALDPDTDTGAARDSVERIDDTDTSEEPEESGEESGQDSGEDVRVEAEYQAFYDVAVIQEVHLTLTDAAIASLNSDGHTWVHGGVDLNGTLYDDVAVRLKGSSTYQDFSGKPAFKIKLNEYVPGQKYGGLERVTLNNMTGDYTQSKEVIDYHLWEEAGMTGPRANYATVWVNDEYFGLYTNIEAMDDHWIERRYEEDEGDLWAANDSADFGRRGLSHWSLQSGVGDEDALEAVRLALLTQSGDFYADMNDVIDMDQFLSYWAWNIAIGNQDGYPFNLNDTFIYGDPADGRFDFSPWGMDESWDVTFYWYGVSGTLATRCLADAACVDRLFVATESALGKYEQMDVIGWAEAAWELSAEAMLEDPRRAWTPADVEYYRVSLASYIVDWPAYMRAQMQ